MSGNADLSFVKFLEAGDGFDDGILIVERSNGVSSAFST